MTEFKSTSGINAFPWVSRPSLTLTMLSRLLKKVPLAKVSYPVLISGDPRSLSQAIPDNVTRYARVARQECYVRSSERITFTSQSQPDIILPALLLTNFLSFVIFFKIVKGLKSISGRILTFPQAGTWFRTWIMVILSFLICHDKTKPPFVGGGRFYFNLYLFDLPRIRYFQAITEPAMLSSRKAK